MSTGSCSDSDPRNDQGNYVDHEASDGGGLTENIQISVSQDGWILDDGLSVVGRVRLVQIQAVQSCRLTAEQCRTEDTDCGDQKEKQFRASGVLIQVTHIGLPEKTENIIKKMGKNCAK